MNDLSFDDGFGRILLEEEPWEQEEEPWEQEEDVVDNPDPSCCATNIPETKEQPQVKIYKRRVDPQPSFFDKRKIINEDKKEEEDLALGDLNLNIDIEKELSKIMCNIPITELMNVPSVRSQVEEFFDGIG